MVQGKAETWATPSGSRLWQYFALACCSSPVARMPAAVPARHPPPAATSPAPSPGKQTVDLSISIRANGHDETSKYTLQCAGAMALAPSGHPRAAEACALLARSPQIMEPAPAPGTQMCTEQYGGPATATVSGTIDGKAASRNFDLTNGCGISAWNEALPLLVDQPTGNLQ